MRTGIFGGTFDPIHHGHLLLARTAAEELSLDRVVFIPTHTSPLKSNTHASTPTDRFAMTQLATAAEAAFEVSTIELDRPPPSYTVDTLRSWKAQFPNDEIFLLIGADNAATFEATWYQPDEIRRLAHLIALDREGSKIPNGWRAIRRLIGISATDIRARVAAGHSIRYLTPDAVCDYIAIHRLYT